MARLNMMLAGACAALALAAGAPAPAADNPVSAVIASVRGPAGTAAFWDRVARQGAPLVEPGAGGDATATVTFLWRGEAREVELQWPVWTPDRRDNLLSRLDGTDIWYKSVSVPAGTRLSYQIAVDPERGAPGDREAYRKGLLAALRPDPLNPARFGKQSLLELPGAVPQPYVRARAGVAKGRLSTAVFDTAGNGRSYEVTIYRPPGVPDGQPVPLVILFDAERYLDAIPTAVILDNMIADGAIPPVRAALIRNPSGRTRAEDLACNPAFADLLADRFLPWLGQRLRVPASPEQVVLGGSSYGGLMATCAAMRHPDRFGAVLSQSGSYWWDPPDAPRARDIGDHEIIRRLRDGPRLPIRFYLDAGLLEKRPGPEDGPDNVDSILLTNRALAAVLTQKGYRMRFRPFAGGHDDAAWRGTLSDGLIDLLGKGR